ncbi:uncharacterized protein [Parasteatoda tepidariorum]|uniref:uncharacterized protein n=1 Tax=Parasteatoda tepidariorum TaxID=114398 RepID=UPI0039BC3FED
MNDAYCLNELKDLGIYISDTMINDRSCLYERDSGEIHLLIRADYAGKILTGKVKHLKGDLVAVHTLLGWTVMGKYEVEGTSTTSSMLVLSLHVNNAKIEDLWNLDTLGIKDSSEKRSKTQTQELALKHFRETVSRDTNRLNDYQEVFNQWEKEGIIEQVNEGNDYSKSFGIHYLPHRAIFKDNSTTKVRPVFDGSAKTKNSVSINECIEKGPNLIEIIPAVLNRFRWGKIGVISDVKQAFLQIPLNESDRDCLRFMWLKDGDPQKIITYRHCRVVFGISCSLFLLAAVLNHVLDQVEEPLKSLAVKIKDSMYVDNCIASVDSVSELEHFRSESQRILKAAKFDLRGWENNNLLEMNEFVQDNPNCEREVSVLGLKWDKQNDTLSCELVKEENNSEPVTKRKILSMAHQLFDPIGFTCPITLIPKLLL